MILLDGQLRGGPRQKVCITLNICMNAPHVRYVRTWRVQ